MSVFDQLDRLTRQNLRVLFISGLLFWASLTALLPTLSLYLDHIGATKSQVGIIMGSFAIGLLLFRPWLGRMADRGGRKQVLLVGLAAVAIAPLGYLFTESMPLLIAIRAFHGLSIAAFTTAYSALVVDLAPPQNRGEVIGYMSLVNPIGLAIGPAVGGYVQAAMGYMPLFLTSTSLGVIGLLAALGIMAPAKHSAPTIATQPQHESFWQLMFSPRFRVPTIVMLMVGLAFGTLSTFVPLFIKETGADLNAGLFYTAAAIASFSVRFLTGRASDRHGRGRFITLSLVLYTLSMLMLWQAKSATVFLLAGVVEGAGAGIFMPTTIALIADRSQPHERGRVFGLCMTGFDLGIAIAGPVLGYFAEQVGYRGLFALASGLTFLGLVTFASQSSKDLSHSLRFAFGGNRDLYALPHSVE